MPETIRPCAVCAVPMPKIKGGRLLCVDCRAIERREHGRRARQRPTNPPDLSRPCGDCGEVIVVGAANKRRFCEPCGAARRRASDRTRQKARRAANGHKAKYRAWCLRTKYGLTVERFEEMLAEQGGCAICDSQTPQWNRDWHVDHDHTTGAVRGILCQKCNALLGYADDRPEVLARAIRYLKPNGWQAPDVAGLLESGVRP